MKKYFQLLLCLALASPLFVLAEGDAYNRIDIQSKASTEVANDLMVVVMSADVTEKESNKVAIRINAIMNSSMKIAEPYSSVKISSGWQNTYPVYDKENQLDGWRGTAQIKITSSDFKAAGELVGKLETSLQISGIAFSVSPDARQKVDDSLIMEGIESFKKRADVVTAALGGTGYRIVKMSTTDSSEPNPRPMLMGMAVKNGGDSFQSPEFSGGDSRLQVRVNGTIEVLGKKN